MKALFALTAIGSAFIIGHGSNWEIGVGVFAAFIAIDLLLTTYVRKFGTMMSKIGKLEG